VSGLGLLFPIAGVIVKNGGYVGVWGAKADKGVVPEKKFGKCSGNIGVKNPEGVVIGSGVMGVSLFGVTGTQM